MSKRSRGTLAYFDRRDGDLPDLAPIAPPAASPESPAEVPIDSLWLDDQPRRIVPDAVLERLIADGRARPAELLAELREIANEHPYYGGVLAALGELARTIAADGVLEPLLVVRQPTAEGERLVLRDGHRRSLGSLLAGKEVVPVRLIDEASALQSTARQLVVNIQRADLTALEKGRWLLRLARLVEDEVRAEQGLPFGPSVVEELVRQGEVGGVSHVSNASADVPAAEAVSHVSNASPGASPAGAVSHASDGAVSESPTEDVSHVSNAFLDTTAKRALAAAVRKRVLELTGLGQTSYYHLIYLNRLTPEAQEAGLGLTEGQLRPVTSLPSSDQAMIVRFVAERKLTAKEAASLVQVAKSGDRDAVQRVMRKLAKEDVAPARSAVSWEPLLHALPKDLWVRLSSLRAELAALPEERRTVRLRALEEQRRLALDFSREIDELLTLYPEGPAEEGE